MSLTDFIGQIENGYRKDAQQINIGNGFYRPGFWVAAASLAVGKDIKRDSVIITSEEIQGYSSALGFNKAVFNDDDYQYVRRNLGQNYSPLVRLDNPEGVDDASSTINACLDAMAQNPAANGMKCLRHVVGELHDNVMSHGCFTGFSMAQRYRVPGRGYCIEFAIADSGLGFLQEIQRARCAPHVHGHEQAIEWCIQKGHTSKPPEEDEWAQALPDDAWFNPHPGPVIRGGMHANHHQGLGLAHLTELVDNYSGELVIASGDTYLKLQPGTKTYHRLPSAWQGVVVCLRLYEDRLNEVNDREADNPAILELVKRLGG